MMEVIHRQKDNGLYCKEYHRMKINIFFLFFISIVNLIYIYFDACIFKLMMSTVRSLSLETTYLIYSFVESSFKC